MRSALSEDRRARIGRCPAALPLSGNDRRNGQRRGARPIGRGAARAQATGDRPGGGADGGAEQSGLGVLLRDDDRQRGGDLVVGAEDRRGDADQRLRDAPAEGGQRPPGGSRRGVRRSAAGETGDLLRLVHERLGQHLLLEAGLGEGEQHQADPGRVQRQPAADPVQHGIAWCADSRSTSSASSPSRTASSTCWRVTSSRSPMNGSATCLRPCPRGASEATSHSRRPIGEAAVGAPLQRAPGHAAGRPAAASSWSGCRCAGSARRGVSERWPASKAASSAKARSTTGSPCGGRRPRTRGAVRRSGGHGLGHLPFRDEVRATVAFH